MITKKEEIYEDRQKLYMFSSIVGLVILFALFLLACINMYQLNEIKQELKTNFLNLNKISLENNSYIYYDNPCNYDDINDIIKYCNGKIKNE